MPRPIALLLLLAPPVAVASFAAYGLAAVAGQVSMPHGIAQALASPAPAPEAPPPASTSAKKPSPLVVATPPKAPRPLVEAEIGACPLTARVVLAVADDDEPSRSLAVVAFPADRGETKPVLREGSYVVGRTVRAITKTRVYLRDARGTCFVGPAAPRSS